MPGAQPVRTTPQPPSPEAQQRLQSSAATPAEMIDAIKNGMGWMSIPELATRIETANPNASPLVKFKALQMGAKLLNAGGQQQLSQMLQWFREDRAEKREKRLEEQWLQSDKERQERLQIAEEKQDPVYQRYKKSSVDLSFKAEQTKAFTSSMEAHVEQLAKLSEKAGVTGQMDLDGFFNAVAAKFGSDTANQYRLQYAETAGEIGKLLSGGMGNAALTEGVRNEAHRVMPEGVVIPAHTLRAMAKTMKANANARYKAYTDRVIAQDKSYKKYKETGVYDYSQEELEGDDSAAPPATAPTIAPPKGVTITPIGQ
jgi:hypothetical protein